MGKMTDALASGGDEGPAVDLTPWQETLARDIDPTAVEYIKINIHMLDGALHSIRADDLAETLAAARESMSPWQSMETAPKDGTRILLLGGFSKSRVSIGEWKGQRRPYWHDESLGRFPCDPAHWMPLPEQP